MHSHHSHSSDYCQHASSSFDEMILRAIEQRLSVLCLTEHMPRIDSKDLYPEEISSETTINGLKNTFNNYYTRARNAQIEYYDKIDLLVGFESESISDEYFDYIDKLREEYKFDLVVGSVHHVSGIPIDFDLEMWNKAFKLSNGGDELIKLNYTRSTLQVFFEEYFDLQYRMLSRLKPTVVAHFDLIRLLAPHGILPESLEDWPVVWQKVVRNVKLAISQGAMIEVNSAAIRKGWNTPYPAKDITSLIIKEGGEFCLSDDSHSTVHVAQNYKKSIEYLEEMGITKVYYLRTKRDNGVIQVVKESISLEDLKEWVNE